MSLEIGTLHHYPYICVKEYKTTALNLETNTSTSFILNTKSNLKFDFDGEEILVLRKTILFLDEGCSFKCLNDECTSFKMYNFNTNIFTSSLTFALGFINREVKKSSKKYLLLSLRDEELDLIEKNFVEFERLLLQKQEICIHKLKDLMCTALNPLFAQKFSNDFKYINSFNELLNTQFNVSHNVSNYALSLGMDAKNLLRLFQKDGFINPSIIIKKKLIYESKKRIIYSSKSIRDICFEMGFSDPTYFSRFFKKNVGVTANYFRKSLNSPSS